MYNIDSFWLDRLSGAKPHRPVNSSEWEIPQTLPDGFVEPSLSLQSGDPTSAKLYIISAPGAVGKSTIARALAYRSNYILVDVAKTAPLGGNFFKGGLINALGFDALNETSSGHVGLIIDGIDEAQLRTTPDGFTSAFEDLFQILKLDMSLPAIIFGRALAADDVKIISELYDISPCCLDINYFNDQQSISYMENRSKLLSQRNTETSTLYNTHHHSFNELAKTTRHKISEVGGGSDVQFSGYAPVLDAICEYSLQPGITNPRSLISQLEGTTPIELINSIALSILKREQGKLTDQLKRKYPNHDFSFVYSEQEQKSRLLEKLTGIPHQYHQLRLTDEIYKDYISMVEQFIGQHPFMDASGCHTANSVFSADIFAWAMHQENLNSTTIKSIIKSRQHISGLLFDVYKSKMPQDKLVPLSHVGILYKSLQLQTPLGKRAALDITSDNDIEVTFSTMDQLDDAQIDIKLAKTTNADTSLELMSPIGNVFIDAPIFLTLGDDETLQINAPTDISVDQLVIASRNIFVHGAQKTESSTIITINSNETDCSRARNINIQHCELQVSWPDCTIHPWTPYAFQPPSPPNEAIGFMRRRFRKIIMSFRSHSKGRLVRFAKKIDSLRMLKDDRGWQLIERLRQDNILHLMDRGVFYELNQDIMFQLLDIDYIGLQKQRYNKKIDDYLDSILSSN